jgi:large exoprotein involved in heme utilization and adhesion
MSGSRIYALNSGAQAGGDININASQSVELVGRGNFAPDIITLSDGEFTNLVKLPTGIFSVTSGSGVGGNLEINAPRIIARDSTFVGTVTTGAGRGGDVSVSASESVQVSASFLDARTAFKSVGDGGNLSVSTTRLNVKEVAVVAAGQYRYNWMIAWKSDPHEKGLLAEWETPEKDLSTQARDFKRGWKKSRTAAV